MAEEVATPTWLRESQARWGRGSRAKRTSRRRGRIDHGEVVVNKLISVGAWVVDAGRPVGATAIGIEDERDFDGQVAFARPDHVDQSFQLFKLANDLNVGVI